MASDIRLSEFKKLFKKFDAEMIPNGNGHYRMRRPLPDGTILVYTIPTKHGRFVMSIYLKKARKAMGLSTEDGITDEEFFK